jgi:hypothetical protein
MEHSMRIAQEIYRTTNDADLHGTFVDKDEGSSKDGMKAEVLLAGLIGRLGLSLEEALAHQKIWKPRNKKFCAYKKILPKPCLIDMFDRYV